MFHGFTAFALNVSNFEATKSTSPLVINIAGNVKQVCMIIISVIIFKQPLSMSSVIGCVVTIGGSFWYSIGSYIMIVWRIERYNFDNRNKKSDTEQIEEELAEDTEPLIAKDVSPVKEI